jgi:hypothetical protein
MTKPERPSQEWLRLERPGQEWLRLERHSSNTTKARTTKPGMTISIESDQTSIPKYSLIKII